MDMENVIGQQYIVQRHKPVRIVAEASLIRPANNGRIHRHVRSDSQRSILRRAEDRDRAASRAASSVAPRSTPRAAPLLEWLIRARSSAIRLMEGLATPRYMGPALIVLGIILLATAIAAAGAAEKTADLRSFSLPEDGAVLQAILDAISMEAAPPEEDSAMPALPLTLSMTSYRVAKNDTLDAISKRFSIRLDTLISANGISDVRRLQAGTMLKIPNLDGVAYRVKKGDSLAGIASARKVSMLDIIDANDLSSQTLVPGQSLFIPGARLSSYDLKKALGQLVIWPVRGPLSSYFGYRSNPFTGVRQFHNGLDIVAAENTPAKAAMDGRVAETGFSSVFGNFVILSHAENYQTLYAHLNRISVMQGTSLAQGATVGLVGSTGYSTGPHLHFSVFKNGVAMDPRKILGSF